MTHRASVPCSLSALLLAAGSMASVAHAQSWASPANGAWFTAANWNPAVVPTGNAAMATLGFTDPYTVSTTSNTVMGVSITNPSATLAINGNNQLVLDGAVNNTLNGTIVVNTGAAFQGTSINIVQPGTAFSGTGVLRLNASGSDSSATSLTARLYSSGNGTLTMGAGTTLAGFGYLGPIVTTNNGTFIADQSGRPLRIEGGSHQNNGLYTSSGGGVLNLIGTTLTQSASGSVAPGPNSSVGIFSSSISGGSIVSTPTGRVVHNSSGTSTLSALTISGGIDLNGLSNTVVGGAGIALGGGATVLVNTGASFQGTHLRAGGAGTPISGNGTIRLNASGSDPSTTNLTASLSTSAPGTSYVFGSGVTVAGFGIVNNVPTVNNGIFNADVASRPLRIEGAAHTNNSLYTATNGGTLVISSTTVAQSPGSGITAVGTSGDGTVNSGVQIASSSITGGSIVSNGLARVSVPSSSVTLSDLSVVGGIDLNGNSNLYINAPGITLVGGATVVVNTAATFSGTHIRTGDAETPINGNGTIRLNASGSDPQTTNLTASISEDGGPAGGSYVFAPGITVAGFGIINSVPTTNNGVYAADVSGRLMRIEGASHQNNNLYTSSNGGTMLLSSTTVTQSGSARILAGEGSALELTSSRVNGGTVGSPNGGTGLTGINGSVTLDGVTASREMHLNPGSTLVLTSNGLTLVSNAQITVNTTAAFSGTRIRADGAPTPIGGTGTIHLNASGSDPSTTNGTADLTRSGTGSYTFGAGITIDGFGRIIDCPTVNDGVINASISGRPLRIDSRTHQNNNAYRSSNGGTLVIANATVNQSGSAFTNAGDGSTVSLNSSELSGGLLSSSGDGRVVVGASSTLNGGLTNSAPVDINGGQTLSIGAAGITNHGVILVNTAAVFSGTRVYGVSPTSTINGNGEVRLNRSGSDPNTNQGTADVGGTPGNTLALGAGQKITGSGRLVGSISMGGTLSPGVGVGGVGFMRNEAGAVTAFSSSGGMDVDLVTAASFDRVLNVGTMVIDGTLRVTAAMDFPAATTFDVVTGGTVTGGFDQVLGTGLASPKRFGATVTPGRVRVTVLCGLADIGGAGADANGDGDLDNNDFIVFIDRFFAQDPLVDFGSPGGVQGSDGLFDNNDFIAFIDLFFAGCF